jgi:multisubunit Na+/H+ antiporter MnhB subunit
MRQVAARRLAIFGFGVIVALIAGVLGGAVLTLPPASSGLADEVHNQLDRAGAKNPVTAVLMNFRGYDTLLEVTVLLLAALGARALGAAGRADISEGVEPGDNPVLQGFIRLVAPVMIVVAGYLLWVGGHAPGGAFQAGAVLAALGVLLLMGGVDWTRRLSDGGERLLLVVGLTAFVAVGVGSMWGNRHLLEYPSAVVKWLTLCIEAAVVVSVATGIIALFRGGSLRSPLRSRRTFVRSG